MKRPERRLAVGLRRTYWVSVLVGKPNDLPLCARSKPATCRRPQPSGSASACRVTQSCTLSVSPEIVAAGANFLPAKETAETRLAQDSQQPFLLCVPRVSAVFSVFRFGCGSVALCRIAGLQPAGRPANPRRPRSFARSAGSRTSTRLGHSRGVSRQHAGAPGIDLFAPFVPLCGHFDSSGVAHGLVVKLGTSLMRLRVKTPRTSNWRVSFAPPARGQAQQPDRLGVAAGELLAGGGETGEIIFRRRDLEGDVPDDRVGLGTLRQDVPERDVPVVMVRVVSVDERIRGVIVEIIGHAGGHGGGQTQFAGEGPPGVGSRPRQVSGADAAGIGQERAAQNGFTGGDDRVGVGSSPT